MNGEAIELIDMGKMMTNGEKFISLFGIAASELWCMNGESLIDWINEDFAIDLLRKAPTAQPEQCEWIPKEVENVPYGLLVECSKCGRSELVDNALYHKYCPNCGRKVITE